MSSFLSMLVYLIPTLLGMGILIFVHELGHYLTARLCGVTIHEFSIGMGKRLGGFTSKKTGIQYSFRLLPIGGYVAMAGEDEEVDDPNAFNKKGIFPRMLILSAGAAMNILTGFLAMLILTGGMVAAGYSIPSATIAEFSYVEDGPALSHMSGLEEGDRIVSINGVKVHTGYDLSYEITFNAYKPVDVVVERDGTLYTIPDVRFPTGEEDGIQLANMDFRVYAAETNFGTVFKTTWYRSVSSIKMVFDSLFGIITGRFTISNMSGPIGVTGAVADVAQQPMPGWNLLYLFALIAMNLGVMNLLPLPALDGGRLFFRLLELLRFGKPIKPEFEARVHGAGMMLLLAFTAFIFLKDLFVMF